MESADSKTKGILVKKASGEEERFSVEKLERSLTNAGAERESISNIISDILQWIYPGVTTKKIYTRAFNLLHKEKASSALRYRLKQAIFELGPTGYPFELLAGQIFKKEGYSIEVGVVVDGMCVPHEMDVIATSHDTQHLAECKYHKDQGKQVSIQVPLYVRSRVEDIVRKRKELPEYQNLSFEGWVITNTRFSSDSITYGTYYGLNLLAWDFPEGKGLKNLVEKHRIYPITILKNLTKKEKQLLMDKELVTCSQLMEHIEEVKTLNLSKNRYEKAMSELKTILEE
jgi:hypothetical protein